MDASTVRGDERGRRLPAVTLGIGFFALVLLAWPSQASAQVQCEPPGCRPLCVAGPDPASSPTPTPLYTLAPLRTGPGDGTFEVTAQNPYGGASYNTNKGPRECASYNAEDAVWEVKHWCTFHCEHRHYFVNPGGMPQPATARVTPVPAEGSFFLGWSEDSACSPPAAPGLSRLICAIRMNQHRTITATFGLAEDSEPPDPAPVLTVNKRLKFQIEFTIQHSEDETWLGGYDVYRNDTLYTRFGPGQATYRATGLLCNTQYAFRVEAFDSKNFTASNTVTPRTTACPKVPPNGVFHVKPPRRTKAKQAFFHWGARRGGADLPQRSFKSKCRLDKKRWQRCSSVNGKTVRKLKPGWHTFRVRVGDSQGWDRTPAVWRWRVLR